MKVSQLHSSTPGPDLSPELEPYIPELINTHLQALNHLGLHCSPPLLRDGGFILAEFSTKDLGIALSQLITHSKPVRSALHQNASRTQPITSTCRHSLTALPPSQQSSPRRSCASVSRGAAVQGRTQTGAQVRGVVVAAQAWEL